MLVTGSEAVLPMATLFGSVLQGGRIDVGFLGAAQIDRWGNLNTSLMANSHEVFVVMRRHDTRPLVGELDFCTSPGPDRALRDGVRPRGTGVTRVITELGILARERVGEPLRLVAVQPGVQVDEIRAATGWDLEVAEELTTAPAPSDVELELLRDEIDPGRIYLR